LRPCRVPHNFFLQVMARCSPQDKLTLVRRLRELGNVSFFFLSAKHDREYDSLASFEDALSTL
jgi:hypothetical protein